MKNKFARIRKIDLLKILIFVALFVGIVMPIIFMVAQIKPGDFKAVFSGKIFAIITSHSLLVSLTATVISLLLASFCAYFLNRSNIKFKGVYIALLTVPMLIPSISHGLGIINLFGANGFIDKIFGIVIEVRGFWGIVLGSVMYSFPVAFLMIYDSLKYENLSIYDAASTLGISGIKSFFCVTIPFLKRTLIVTFFAIFTMIFTDYGVPMAVGGKYSTLPVYLYQEVINRMNFSKGAIIGMFLILPALVAFVVDVLIKDNSASEAQQRRIKPTILFNTISRIFLILIIVVLLVPSISFVVISFTKSFPNDLSFTMEHLNYVIKRDIWAYFTNSIFISILTGILGTILVYFTAYLTTRVRGKFCKILHLISIFTLAIPGIVLGLGYIFLFKKSFIYGTFMIIIIANMVHFFSSPYLLAQNAMNKINREFETVGMTLGVSRLKTFIHVVIPCTLGTIFEMFIYYFVNSMVTISAVAFLYNIYTMPLSIMITQFESQIAYEAAAIVSLFILVTNIIAKTIVGIVQKVINKRMN